MTTETDQSLFYNYLHLFSLHSGDKLQETGERAYNNQLLDIDNPESNLLRKRLSKENSQDPIIRKTLNSFSDFQAAFMPLTLDETVGLAFRGQTKAWSLHSPLKRLLHHYDVTGLGFAEGNYLKSEDGLRQILVNEPSAKYWDPLTLSPKPFDDQVFAIAQHYGVPTPLLDWTLNMDVALFFAYENAPGPECDLVAIYIVDVGKMHVMNHRATLGCSDAILDSQTLEGLNYKEHRNTWTFVWPKYYADIRLSVQSGLFAKQQFELADVMRSLEDFLETPKIDPLEDATHKPLAGTLWIIQLPASERPQVMEYLERKGVTRRNLFISWDDICKDLVSQYRNSLIKGNSLVIGERTLRRMKPFPREGEQDG